METSLLLTGLGRDQRYWGNFKSQLTTSLESSVSCLDYIGSGTEAERKSPAHVRGIAQDLRERWVTARKAMGKKDENLTAQLLIGLSFGGMLALDWAAQHPEDFKGLVIMNTSAHGLNGRRLSPRAIRIMAEVGLSGNIELNEQKITQLVSHRPDRNAHVIAERVAFYNEVKTSRLNGWKHLLAASQFVLNPRIKIPVLVLISAQDLMVDADCSRAIAKALRQEGGVVTVQEHPWAGHEITLDDPIWVAEKISEWARTAAN